MAMRFLAAATIVLVFTCRAMAQETVLSGTVTDATGGVLPGVTVTATHQASGNTFVAITDAAGSYRLGLRTGVYRVLWELSGFASVTREGLTLLVGQQIVSNVQLAPATLAETITVTGEAPLIDTTQSRLGGNIDARQVSDLPVNGRNWMQLSMLAPGSRMNTAKDVPVERESAAAGVNFNLNVDGQQVTNLLHTSDSGSPEISRDAVAEFEFVSNRFDARQGRTSGVQVNVITKSGSNAFNGSLGGYFRDDQFNAKDFIVDRVLTYSNQQYGGTFGGPIRKDRVHFFVNYEGEREPQTVTFTSPYPRFNIPDLIGHRNEHKAGARVDTQFSLNSRLMARWNKWRNNIPYSVPQLTPGATNHPSTMGGGFQRSDQVFGSFTQTFGSRTVNEIRAGFAAYEFNYQLAVPTAPSILFRGYTFGPRVGYPHFLEQREYSVRDDVTIVRGTHDLKFGGEYIMHRMDMEQPNNIYGTIDATGGPVPANIEDLFPVWNDPATWNLAALSPITIRFRQNFGSYAVQTPRDTGALWIQDDWTISRRFTLNLGFRYDVSVGAIGDRAPAFDPWRPAELIRSDLTNFVPRVGFAYLMNDQTVIRGGWGKYFAETVDNVNHWTVQAAQRATPETPNDGRPDFAANPYNGPQPTYESVIASGVRRDLSSSAADPSYRTPYSYQSSIGFQRQLGAVTSVSADYAWTGGHREYVNRNRNLNYDPATGINYPYTNVSLRPYPNWGRPGMMYSEGWSNYQALQTALTRRFSGRWQAAATYTLAWFKDGVPNPSWVPFPLAEDLGERYSYAISDQRHRAVVNGIVELPVGFQLSGLYFFGSGMRFPTSYGGDLRNTGGTEGSGLLRPDGTVVARNDFVGSALHRVDVRAQRRFRLMGRATIDGIFEVFNLFNHANYGSYTTAESNRLYGTPSQNPNVAYQPRMMQLGFRFAF